MKLKTLKDFGKIYAEYDRTNNDYSDPNVSVKELKQEAINWLLYSKVKDNTKSWIVKFFNIEEEDLE